MLLKLQADAGAEGAWFGDAADAAVGEGAVDVFGRAADRIKAGNVGDAKKNDRR